MAFLQPRGTRSLGGPFPDRRTMRTSNRIRIVRLICVATLLSLATSFGSSSLAGPVIAALRYNGPVSGGDVAYDIALSADGTRAYVTGTSIDAVRADVATVAYDTTSGRQLWAARIGPADSEETGWSIAVSADGSQVFVTGYSISYVYPRAAMVTLAYAASSGVRLWTAVHSSSRGVTSGPWLAVDPDGASVYVAGTVIGPGGSDFGTIAYNATTGQVRWEATYNHPGGGIDYPYGIAVDSERVYVTGDAGPYGVQNFATVAYDAGTGTQQWVAEYDDPEHGPDVPYAIGVGPGDNTVYVTGTSNLDLGTIAYDAATGTQRWIAIEEGLPIGGGAGYALAVSPAGDRVFIAGNKGLDYAMVAYRAQDGTELWEDVPDGPYGDDQATAVGVSPDGGRVYVTGYSPGPNGYWDYRTLAYGAASGTLLASHRYDGPAHLHDRPYALALAPDGMRLYVIGFSDMGPPREEDYTTLVYSLP